jgi:pimeloyl-ACP methyl ester carboxylesterase
MGICCCRGDGESPIATYPLGQTTETLHAHLPNSQVTVLPGQQHSAMLTAPELFAKEVVKFLK